MARKQGELYPPIEPYNHGWLRVSDIHEIYYEESGNRDGNPVVLLHGGPGVGCFPEDRQLFDPAAYRIILLDQRGAGKSRPFAEIQDNTTWDLVSDLEKLREHLGVTKWVVTGGSWGSTLALAYSQTHPDRVKALILYGLCTFKREEHEWFYQKGASFLFPDRFDKLVEPIPEAERGDIIAAYNRRLLSDDKEEQIRFSKIWSEWEIGMLMVDMDPGVVEKMVSNTEFCLGVSRIENNYIHNRGWFEEDDQLLKNVDIIRHIPATIVQGKFDTITPMRAAWELHKRWPEAVLQLVPKAGHWHIEPALRAKLIEATDEYKTL